MYKRQIRYIFVHKTCQRCICLFIVSVDEQYWSSSLLSTDGLHLHPQPPPLPSMPIPDEIFIARAMLGESDGMAPETLAAEFINWLEPGKMVRRRGQGTKRDIYLYSRLAGEQDTKGDGTGGHDCEKCKSRGRDNRAARQGEGNRAYMSHIHI